MEHKEFYKLLNQVMTKKDSKITPTEDNYNGYLMNRYLSFHSEYMPIILSRTTNIMGWIPESDDPEMNYKCIKNILPIIPKNYIKYIKKPAVVLSKEHDITQEQIEDEARYYECSKREIRALILDYCTKNKQTN